MEFTKPVAYTEALEKIGQRSIVGSQLSSAEWRDVPVGLRERAFFSSRVESTQFLQRAKDGITEFMSKSVETLDNGQTALATGGRADFVKQMTEFLKGEGIERQSGEITDIAGERRLNLIFDTQVRQAHDYGYAKQGWDPDVLDAFPAQRFIRVAPVEEPRDWHIQFEDEVRLKSDVGFWTTVNQDFGVPWGPWGWGCQHDVEDVDRAEAEALGLLEKGAAAAAPEKALNDHLQASVRNIDSDLREHLDRAFGDKVKWEKNAVWWKGDRASKAMAVPPKPRAPKRRLGEWPTDLGDLEDVRGLGGSTGAKLVRDKVTGEEFVMKRGASAAHVTEEFAADQLYRLMGAAVPEARMIGQTKLAKFIPGAKTLQQFMAEATTADTDKVLKQVRQHFVADSLLGNWDVAGLKFDNILVDAKGVAWRIDNGGALRFRAQGAAKAEFGPKVTELDTLRDARVNAQTATLFKEITDTEIDEQIARIVAVKDELVATAPEAVREVLRSRIDNLAARLERGPFSGQFVESARKARVVGRAARMDRGDIEDAQALVWQETGADGKPVTRITLRLTEDGNEKALAILRKYGSTAEELFDEDSIYNQILQAAKTVNHHVGDGAYNATKLEALKGVRNMLDSAVGAGTIAPTEALKYVKMVEEITTAASNRSKAPMVSRVGIAVNKPVTQPGQIAVKQGPIEFEAKEYDRGFAKSTGSTVWAEDRGYKVESGGARAQFKPYGDKSKNYSLQGQIDITVPEELGPQSLSRAKALLDTLGVETAVASREYNEAVYLWKGLYLRSDKVPAELREKARRILTNAAITDRERVTQLRTLIKDEAKLPIASGEAYQPDGVANGFGDGRRVWHRWDLPREKVEKEMSEYTLALNSSTETVSLLDQLLAQGGEFTPTVERLRKGVPINTGMSPSTDMHNGTSPYMFTRIAKRTEVSRGQWHFKAGNLARQDAMSFKGDWLDGHSNIWKDSVQEARGKTVADFKRMARNGGNETLLKHGLNILDELDTLYVRTLSEKERVLATFRKHKITRLNDGRTIEEVVKLR